MGNLFDENDHKATRKDYFMINPLDIEVVDEWNARIDYGDMESLIASGVRVPLRGSKKGDKYILRDGHRRFKAVQAIIADGGFLRVPFIMEKAKSEEELLVEMFVFNDGKPFEPIEEAGLILRLTNYGWKPAQIAKKIGKSSAHISNMLILAHAPTSLKAHITEKKISATTAIEMLRENKDAPDEVAAKVDSLVKNKGTKKKITKKTAGLKKTAFQKNLDEFISGDYEFIKDWIENIDTTYANITLHGITQVQILISILVWY